MKFEYSLQDIEQCVIDGESCYNFSWKSYVDSYFEKSPEKFLYECNQYKLINVFFLLYSNPKIAGPCTNRIDYEYLAKKNYLNLIQFSQDRYPFFTFSRLAALDTILPIYFLVNLGIKFTVNYIYTAETPNILMKNRLKYTVSYLDREMRIDIGIDSRERIEAILSMTIPDDIKDTIQKKLERIARCDLKCK